MTRFNCQNNVGGLGSLGGGLFDDVISADGSGGEQQGGGQLSLTGGYTSSTPVGFPIQSINLNQAPIIWAKMQTPGGGVGSTGPTDDSRFIVFPDGRSGINVANPRCALDVRGFGMNAPAAIFGVNAQRAPFAVQGTPLLQRYTQHLQIVPHCSGGAYNPMIQQKDIGIIFTDGMGNEGSNTGGALVIAPWRTDGVAAGLRMEPNGNILIRGNIEAQGKLTCNGFIAKPKWWPDYVFDEDYDLVSLDSISLFIKKFKHLPGMPSEKMIIEQGQDIAQLQILQQEKIEELMLLLIQKEQEIDDIIIKLKVMELQIKELSQLNK